MGDKLALKACLHFLCTFDIREQNKARSHFLLIPLMHSENLTIQKSSLPLFQNHTSEEVYKYALRHKKSLIDLAGSRIGILSLEEYQQKQKINYKRALDLHSKCLMIIFTLFNRV